MPEVTGGLQLALARREAGYAVGENPTDDMQLALLCAPGAMGGHDQACRLQIMAAHGLGPKIFNKVIGASVGGLNGAAFVSGQHDVAAEIIPYLAQTEFMDISVAWNRTKRSQRPAMNLPLLQALMTEDPYFALDTKAVHDSNTELLVATAHRDSLSTIIRSTKREPRIGQDDLIPTLMKGASMPVMGPEMEGGELDGATWCSDVMRHWNQAAREASQTPDEASKTHLIILENAPIALRPRNLLVAPLVARWLARRSEAGMSTWDAYKQFVRGQAEPTLNAVAAYLTGSLAASAASVQIIRPSQRVIHTTGTNTQKFEKSGLAAQADTLHILANPDSVPTYKTTAARPSVAQALARQALGLIAGQR